MLLYTFVLALDMMNIYTLCSMDSLLRIIKKAIPRTVFQALQPAYHKLLATLSAYWYGHPGQKLYVVFVTGTKGKSTVAELIAAILEEAGHTVALSNTIRFKIGDESRPNLYKMSMPGRFFMQKFLHDAVQAGCDYAVIEATSEGAKLFRHLHLYPNALVFTNLAREHIESHGSFENYRDAKLSLRDAVAASPKEDKCIVANRDDEHGAMFLDVRDVSGIAYSIKNAEPYVVTERGVLITFEGMSIHSPLLGKYNISNILAAATFIRTQHIPVTFIKKAIEKISTIAGRGEKIEEGQNFTVIVDYAHTPDSLEALYTAFPDKRKICVLGNTGGGRDAWKRPEMASIADTHCMVSILTDEDPYDEDPVAIINAMKEGFTEHDPEVIINRREAIRAALSYARDDDVVLITGKGTDPYIMEAKGKKTPWSDAQVAHEELQALLNEKQGL